MCGALAQHGGKALARILWNAQANLPRGQLFQFVKRVGVVHD